MASLKPSKPEIFEGKRDSLAVNSWLYQVDTYLNLLALSSPELNLTDEIKIQFASTLLKSNAANWYYMRVQAGDVPNTWDDFKNGVRNEFVPQDNTRRQRDKLNKLIQNKSVASYLESFRNTVIAIPDISEAEKLDKFLNGLKPMIRLEVLKSGCDNMNDASRIALNVDSALYGAGMFHGQNQAGQSSGPQPMDIGNIQSEPHYRGKAYKGKKKGKNKARSQRAKDLANGTCFICHKKGCRASNHYKDDVSNQDSKVRFEDSSSDQEN